jgi:hypothetical protein
VTPPTPARLGGTIHQPLPATAPATAGPPTTQAVVTVATGPFAEKLDYTFSSFLKNPFLSLHAFIIGEALPARQVPGVVYHLEKSDPGFSHEMREAYYRRFLFIDQLEEKYALIVDNSDVLCLQPIPELPALLRGASFAGCVEHAGSRYLAGQGYTSQYINCGVTLWDTAKSGRMRREIVERGRSRFRSVDDQLTLNEVMHTRYYDEMIILPCQYNFRAHYKFRQRGWPTVESLDGVKIYHNAASMAEARKLTGVRRLAELPPLEPDAGPLTPWEQFKRKIEWRLQKHRIR